MTGAPFGLTPGEARTLARLQPPAKLQRFLDDLDYDVAGASCRSPRRVLRERKVQCMDGALFAAAALRVQGHRALILDFEAVNDVDHVIAVFRQNGGWGGLARSNYAGLRYREPIHRTLRELALSYFHEYSNRRGHKTLRSYSCSFDLRRVDPAEWVTNTKSCWRTHDRLVELRHFDLISKRQERLLAKRDPFERRASRLVEYPKPEIA